MSDAEFATDSAGEPEDEFAAAGGAEEEAEEGAPAWMVTFGDMMSLLVCFFVLIVSFSTMDVVKYRQLVGSMRQAFGATPAVQSTVVIGSPASIHAASGMQGEEALTDEMLEHELTDAIEAEGPKGQAALKRTERGLALTLNGESLFATGSAELESSAYPLLSRVAKAARFFPRQIYVEGHTDNVPLRGGFYLSNWELSAARACAIVRYLTDVEHIAPEKFVACGYAATMPVASNRTAAGRAQNRRVEFIFSAGDD